MLKVLYNATGVPTTLAGKKENTRNVDMPVKLFDEIALECANRSGGYTRIAETGQRKGNGTMEVVLELV